MSEIRKITSLTEYMGWVKSAQNRALSESKDAFLYCGHADAEFKLQPKVYRINDKGESFRAVEYHLYQRMLHRNPLAFAEDRTVFDRLVRLQHYGLPTRLLDLTENPMVACFLLATNSRKRKNREKTGKLFFSALTN